MTNQKILTKAIKLAIAGGWRPHTDNGSHVEDFTDFEVIRNTVFFDKTKDGNKLWSMSVRVCDIIFNSGFAETLWSSYGSLEDGSELINLKRWQFHLQQMVTADDPIKYLGENS